MGAAAPVDGLKRADSTSLDPIGQGWRAPVARKGYHQP